MPRRPSAGGTVAVLLAVCIPLASGFIDSGEQYYVQHKGGRDNCASEVELLGYLNKTCQAGTKSKAYGPTCGPVLRTASDGKHWKEWTITVVGQVDGNDLVTIENFYPAGAGAPLCLGNMVPEKQGECTAGPWAPRVHIHPGQPYVWRLVPVPGDEGSFQIVAESRGQDCLRFLGGASMCGDKYLQLFAADDGSGQQRWVLTRVNPPSPPPPPPPVAGQPPSVAVSAVTATTAFATVTPPPGGCTPVTYELAHAPANALVPPSLSALPAGALSTQFGNLFPHTQYTVTAVGTCADGTKTPPSVPAVFNTILGMNPPPPACRATGESCTIAPDCCTDPCISSVCTTSIVAVECFPAAAAAIVQGRGAVRMDALRVGDAVLSVGFSGALEWQEVYFFAKRQHDIVGGYRQLLAAPADGAPALELRISGPHFVPVTLDAGGWCNQSSPHASTHPPSWASHVMVAAQEVTPGMVLWAADHTAPGAAPACVTANHRILDSGAYSPHVRASALVVDSVAASSHIQGAYMTPHRLPFAAALSKILRIPASVVDQPVSVGPNRWKHQPALYDAFLAPLFWLYLALGAPAMDALCSLPVFRGWGAGAVCPTGLWYCVGGNVLWALWLAAGWFTVRTAVRLARGTAQCKVKTA